MSGKSWDRAVFDRLYAADPDPWRFDSSPYEAAKYADTLACLGEARFARALELGCANGAMTTRLAERCAALLAVDIAPAAAALARARCAGQPQVSVVVARLPDELDQLPGLQGPGFDLVVVSEVLYFLSPEDIDRLAARLATCLAADALVLLVNWTGHTDTPCTGEQAADRFVAALTAGLPLTVRTVRRDRYRLDEIRRRAG